jgi:hypothetical protein
MGDTSLRTPLNYSETLARRGTDWSAVWSGVFVFAAIWAVFETLALAIFAGAAIPLNPRAGVGAEMAIWAIVLTIIAMYVAGRETGRAAGVVTRHSGLMHGMMMFGLSVLSAIVLGLLGACVTTGGTTTVGASHPLMNTGVEWTMFITLLLGWLAAMGGAAAGARPSTVNARQPVPMRPAA